MYVFLGIFCNVFNDFCILLLLSLVVRCCVSDRPSEQKVFVIKINLLIYLKDVSTNTRAVAMR